MFKIVNNGILPTMNSFGLFELYANGDFTIMAGESMSIPLGIKIDEKYIQENIENLQDEKHKLIEIYSGGDCVDFFKKSHYIQITIGNYLYEKGLSYNGNGIVGLDYKGEIEIKIGNPITEVYTSVGIEAFTWNEIDEITFNDDIVIKHGDLVAELALIEHKSYLLGGIKNE